MYEYGVRVGIGREVLDGFDFSQRVRQVRGHAAYLLSRAVIESFQCDLDTHLLEYVHTVQSTLGQALEGEREISEMLHCKVIIPAPQFRWSDLCHHR